MNSDKWIVGTGEHLAGDGTWIVGDREGFGESGYQDEEIYPARLP